jgi:predicted enzyme related to lactoylglutathione lyase
MFKNAKYFSSFSVDDIVKARQFYADVLGLDMTDIMGMMQLNMSGGQNIFVYSKPNHTPATYTVLNFIVDDIEKAVKELTEKGVTFEIYDLPDIKTDEKGISLPDERGPRMAWFKDPAGNVLAVMQQMEK